MSPGSPGSPIVRRRQLVRFRAAEFAAVLAWQATVRNQVADGMWPRNCTSRRDGDASCSVDLWRFARTVGHITLGRDQERLPSTKRAGPGSHGSSTGPEVGSRRNRRNAISEYSPGDYGALTRIAQRAFLRPYVKRRFNPTVKGSEKLLDLQHKAVVLVANHTSDVDTALIFSHVPPAMAARLATGAAADRFFTSKSRAFVPQLLFNAYPVERRGTSETRNYAGMSDTLLGSGTPLLIYPEGTRRGLPGVLGRFSLGPARLAQRHDVPVVPIAIWGAAQAWPVGARRPTPGRHSLFLTFCDPIYPRWAEPALLMTRRIRESIVREYNAIAQTVGDSLLHPDSESAE